MSLLRQGDEDVKQRGSGGKTKLTYFKDLCRQASYKASKLVFQMGVCTPIHAA